MDPIRDWLRAQDCGDHVIRDGLEGLVREWEKWADKVASEYDGVGEEWLNEVDGRQILFELTPLIGGPEHEPAWRRIEKADRLFKDSTAVQAECMWGPANERRHGWNSELNWWYYRKPLRSGPNWVV